MISKRKYFNNSREGDRCLDKSRSRTLGQALPLMWLLLHPLPGRAPGTHCSLSSELVSEGAEGDKADAQLEV